MFGGATLTHTFKATDTLVDVNRHIMMNRTDDGSPYSLVTNFLKRMFQPADMDTVLNAFMYVSISVLVLVDTFNSSTGYLKCLSVKFGIRNQNLETIRILYVGHVLAGGLH